MLFQHVARHDVGQLRRRRDSALNTLKIRRAVAAQLSRINPVEPVGVLENQIAVAGRRARGKIDLHTHVHRVRRLDERPELNVHINAVAAQQPVVQIAVELKEVFRRVRTTDLTLPERMTHLADRQQVDRVDAHAGHVRQQQHRLEKRAGLRPPRGCPQTAVGVVIPRAAQPDEHAVDVRPLDPRPAAFRLPARGPAPLFLDRTRQAAPGQPPRSPSRQDDAFEALQRVAMRIDEYLTASGRPRVGISPAVPEQRDAIGRPAAFCGLRGEITVQDIEIGGRKSCHVSDPCGRVHRLIGFPLPVCSVGANCGSLRIARPSRQPPGPETPSAGLPQRPGRF